MKVTTVEQMRGMDRRAIAEFGVPDQILMENAGLSEVQMEVVCLVFLEGLPVSAAAARLSKNPGTVHHHLERALTKLATRAALLRIQP